MRRYNGLNFQNDLNTFINGLDNHQSFWIGLDTLCKLTAGTYNTLRIEYVTTTYKHEIIDYKGFQIIKRNDYWATYDYEIVVKGTFFFFGSNMNRSRNFKLIQEIAVLETSVKVGLSPSKKFVLFASMKVL